MKLLVSCGGEGQLIVIEEEGIVIWKVMSTR